MDLSELKGIISLMQKSDLTDLEIETQDLKLRLGRPSVLNSVVVQQPEQTPVTIQKPQEAVIKTEHPSQEGEYIFKSPMVGTFYRKPSPDDPSFVSVGDITKKGDVLCIVEAMKVMNEIQSDVTGEILEILVEDSVSIEYGQPLFRIRK